MSKESNNKRNNNSSSNLSLLNLDNEDFLLWKEQPITQLVIKLHRDRKTDLLTFIEEAALSGTILNDIEQVRIHESLRMYDEFIELDYEDIAEYYGEIEDDEDTARMGKGVSFTG